MLASHEFHQRSNPELTEELKTWSNGGGVQVPENFLPEAA